jgi:hypothetical protein
LLKILLPKSEEVSFRKEERTCFRTHEEQYFESIKEVGVETLGKELYERQDSTFNIKGSIRCLIIYFFFAFPRIVFVGCLFDTP